MSEAREKLRQRWDERYATFSLDESGCLGAGPALNRLIYRAKQQAVRKALRLAQVQSGRAVRVLDMGCGLGYFAALYQREFPRSSYTGVDISERAIGHARESIPHGQFFAHDIVSWRHPGGERFDVVQSVDVLQLLTDDRDFEGALTNMALHLGQGGVMLMPMMFGAGPAHRGHQRVRTRAYFDALLERLGLVVTAEVRMYYWVIDGGSRNRLLRALFARTGAWSLYLVDRLALKLGLENRDPEHALSRQRMLVIRRAEPAAASGPRSTASGN